MRQHLSQDYFLRVSRDLESSGHLSNLNIIGKYVIRRSSKKPSRGNAQYLATGVYEDEHDATSPTLWVILPVFGLDHGLTLFWM